MLTQTHTIGDVSIFKMGGNCLAVHVLLKKSLFNETDLSLFLKSTISNSLFLDFIQFTPTLVYSWSFKKIDRSYGFLGVILNNRYIYYTCRNAKKNFFLALPNRVKILQLFFLKFLYVIGIIIFYLTYQKYFYRLVNLLKFTKFCHIFGVLQM